MRFSQSIPGRGALACVLLALDVSTKPAPPPRNPQEPRNLVENGSFENPAVAAGASEFLVESGAWTAKTGTIEVRSSSGGATPLEGRQLLALESWAVVSQTCRTRAGQAYALSFAYTPDPGSPDLSFEVWYAGALVDTIAVTPGRSGWMRTSYAVVGVTSADELEFRCLAGSPNGVWIDDCWLMPYSTTATDQLLRNGNFEDDPVLPANGTIENPVIQGWSTGKHYDILVQDLGTTGNGYDGKNVMHLRERRAEFQQVYVVPLQPYELRFAYSPNPADDRDRSFTVSFGGQVLDTIAVPRAPALGWTLRTYTVTTASPLTTVEFKDLGDGPIGALLDGVSLIGPAPQPDTAGQVSRQWVVSRTPLVPLDRDDMFARGMTSLGDLDGDGVQDLAIGAVGDDDGAEDAGAVWITFMNANRTMRASQKISALSGGLVATLRRQDGFGRALTGIGDLDLDGIPDIAVGANEDDTGGRNAGSVYVLFLTRQGTVRAQHKITALSGDVLDYVPVVESNFGAALCCMGDVDGDGIPDIAVGSRFGDSVQTCFLNRDGTVRASKNITYGANGFTDTVTSPSDFFGMSCANMGDFDGNGVNDLLAGAFGRRTQFMVYVGGQYLMLLERDGSVKQWFYYGYENLNLRTQTLGVNYNLGTSCVGLGDVDGDGVLDLATGAQREGPIWGLEREESTNQGYVYVLLLNIDGTVKTCQRIGDRVGGLDLTIGRGARWGESLCRLGDWDGNGLVDVGVGSRFVFGTGAAYFCELQSAPREDVPVPVQANFSGSPTSGQAPLTVQFTDLSTGPVTSWSWDFGDGTGTTGQSASHVYSAAGLYSVRLSVNGGGTTSSKTLTDLVDIRPAGGDELPRGIVKLGCGTNPPGSFRLLAGVPRIGTTMTFGVDNPLGTQASGSIPLVVASWGRPANYPCGMLVAARGMASPTAPGEQLVGNSIVITRRGTKWTGPGNPAPVLFPIPNDAGLVGRTMYLQGRLQDRADAPIPLAFADGFALTFQP